jgi:hypothetical protein
LLAAGGGRERAESSGRRGVQIRKQPLLVGATHVDRWMSVEPVFPHRRTLSSKSITCGVLSQ